MHPLVADLAVAEVPEPMPVVVDQILVVGLLRRGSKPKVEVQSRRRLHRRFEGDAPPRLAGIAVRNQQTAVLAAADRRHLPGANGGGAILRAVLDDAIVFSRRFDQVAALGNVMAARFFDVRVLARLAGPNAQKRVPMGWRGDGDDVQILVVQNRSQISNALGRIAAAALHHFAARIEQAAVGIDQIGDLDVLHAAVRLNMIHATPVDAGHRDANPIIGAQHSARSSRAAAGKGGGDESAGRGPLQKIATIVAGHDSLSTCDVVGKHRREASALVDYTSAQRAAATNRRWGRTFPKVRYLG